jgi:uncharacterized membrane protein YfcA
MLTALVLFLVGIAIATISMAVGIGGGILWTPLLIFAYGLNAMDAVTSSLLIQCAGLASGTIAYRRNANTNFRLSFFIFLAALPGIVLGSFATHYLVSEDFLKLLLGIMALILAIMFVARQKDTDEDKTLTYSKRDLSKLLPIPGFFGFIMGMLSLGIGEWLIPSLRARLHIGMRQAVGIVIPAMLMLVLLAAAIHLYQSESLSLLPITWGALGTLVGAQIGAQVSQRINERLLKESFIYLMTLIGVHFIYNAI